MKQLLSLLLIVWISFSLPAASSWRMHSTFNDDIRHIIDIGDKVYFTSRTQPFDAGSKLNKAELHSLFCFDKESEEVYALNANNLLASNVIATIDYSSGDKMLVVVHTNQDIDLVYNDGKVKNIPDLRYASMGTDKDVNSIFIDYPANRIFLATKFGYVEINSKKFEVAESRIYNTDVTAVSKVGSKFLMLVGNKLLAADNSSRRMNLSDFSVVDSLTNPIRFVNVGENYSLLVDQVGSKHNIYAVTETNGKITLENIISSWVYGLEHVDGGMSLATGERIYLFSPDGTSRNVMRSRDDYHILANSRDLREVWYGVKRKGIMSKECDSEGNWTLTRDYLSPNAPAPYMVDHMTMHPSRGLLVVNHGHSYDIPFDANGGPIALSAYKDGLWENLSPIFTNPTGTEHISNPLGVAVDPQNENYVYFGSIVNGMERINITNGEDVIHLSRYNDPYKNYPNFVGFVSDQIKGVSPLPEYSDLWSSSCPFSAPKFDYYGNLWTTYANYTDQVPKQLHLYCWTPADRAATTSAQDIKLPVAVPQEGILTYNIEYIEPLLHYKHRNLILHSTAKYDSVISVIDTNGTATDNSDDKQYIFNSLVDQDGNTVDANYIRFMWEDLSTGYVWVGHQNGVFYFNPDDITNGTMRIYRIKVARNDGTNLADYLLDGVPVLAMTSDGTGRKWFATKGGGLACSSSDGRTIERMLNSSNSELPDDIVYSLAYIPASNSLMIGTASGLAEYFIGGTASAAVAEDEVRAYPNPVRPGYAGYVTIDNIPRDSLVKIVDASGNLIKELGVVSDGEAKWDVTDTAFRRVSSGVYFILASSSEEGESFASVGKILVVN